jgi:hypothetical protein
MQHWTQTDWLIRILILVRIPHSLLDLAVPFVFLSAWILDFFFVLFCSVLSGRRVFEMLIF